MISYHSPTVLQEIVGFPVTPPLGAAEADKNNNGRYSSGRFSTTSVAKMSLEPLTLLRLKGWYNPVVLKICPSEIVEPKMKMD